MMELQTFGRLSVLTGGRQAVYVQEATSSFTILLMIGHACHRAL